MVLKPFPSLDTKIDCFGVLHLRVSLIKGRLGAIKVQLELVYNISSSSKDKDNASGIGQIFVFNKCNKNLYKLI